MTIRMLGNDHVISDVIIFGGQTGVYCDHGANLIEGVHTWNDGTHAASPGHGIVVDETQGVRVLVRITYCTAKANALSICTPCLSCVPAA